MLIKVANKDTENVVSALIKQPQRLPSKLYRSLTWDTGKELADHQRLTLATQVDRLLLRPSLSLAARVKRKHQQIAAPVSSAWRVIPNLSNCDSLTIPKSILL
jgi:IS30 family transposase